MDAYPGGEILCPGYRLFQPALPYLTGRELEVLRGLGEGRTDREIAQALGVSEKTVHHHVGTLLAKLSARNRTHAVVQALRLGLIDID